MTFGNEQWKPGYSLAVVPKEGNAGEPVTKIQASPWPLVSEEDPAGDSNQMERSNFSLADGLTGRPSSGSTSDASPLVSEKTSASYSRLMISKKDPARELSHVSPVHMETMKMK